MALLEKQLFIHPSIIPNAGMGLFTSLPIKKGTRIVEYKGRITTWENACHKGGNNPYIFFVNKDYVIDGLTYKKSFARYINDAKGLTRIKGISNNTQFIVDGVRVYIEAIKNIPANTEILVGYGKEYWDTIKENMKSS
ncbi:MAG: SET domain-containing protein [Chitinophagaceae bacterium]